MGAGWMGAGGVKGGGGGGGGGQQRDGGWQKREALFVSGLLGC